MYRYFIGAFGNRSFICPQYEIMEDGSLREMRDSRWKEFPNGGTVSLANISDGDTDDIKNRLLQFRVDFNKDFHPSFDVFSDNSNRYQITLPAVDDFDKDEIIEIIDISYPIEDFLNDKTKQTMRIKHKPNKQILLRLSDGELREKQTANYFSDIYPIDCAVLSANAQSCPKCCTLLPVLLSA